MRYANGLAVGTYDLFHIGHLRFLETASSMCETLTVAVDSDERVLHYKHHLPVIGEENRAAILNALKCVDSVVIQRLDWDADELIQLGADVVFVGSNWQNNPVWKKKSDYLWQHNVETVFIPPIPGVSTTQIIKSIKENDNI